MPRGQWPLVHDRPAIEIVLSTAGGAQQVGRILLADTGAGTARSGFEIVLNELRRFAYGNFGDPQSFGLEL